MRRPLIQLTSKTKELVSASVFFLAIALAAPIVVGGYLKLVQWLWK